MLRPLLALTAIALPIIACSPPPVEIREAPETTPRVQDLTASLIDASVRLVDPEKASEPVFQEDRRSAFLPVGVRLDVPLLLPANAELRFGRLALRDKAMLDVHLRTDSGGTRQIAKIEQSGEDVSVALGIEETTPALLILRSRGRSRESGVLIERASLQSPPVSSTNDLLELDLSEERPPIVLYVIDTLRRDRLGCYGYDRPTSPNLDAFASEAVLFERAIGQSSWTMASMASAFTGTWPAVHGVIDWHRRLPEEALTLAEILQERGYRNAAFVANPLVGADYGFQQGFDQVVDQTGRSSFEIGRLVAEELPSTADQSFFLWIQTMDPHAPYDPPEPYLSRFAPDHKDMPPIAAGDWDWPAESASYLSDLYDAEVAANDAAFGELRAELQRLGVWDRAIVIVMSDHGEEFQEHGRWQHGNQLYTETLDVPLIVKLPGQKEGFRVEHPVQHADLLPSLLDLLDASTPANLDGESWFSANLDERLIYSHLDLDEAPPMRSLVLGDWKMVQIIRPEEGVKNRLFHLPSDPLETTNTASDHPIRVRVFETLLAQKLRESDIRGEALQAGEVEIRTDEATRKMLESLGYLQD